MSALTPPFLDSLLNELLLVRSDVASLETLVAKGATVLGGTGIIEAQKLDSVVQSIDCLVGLLADLGDGKSLDQSIATLPLAQMATRFRLGSSGAASLSTACAQPSIDPELF